MKYIILSDIHSNLEAFEAVVGSFPGGDDVKIVCVGDTVGYGANPNECIELIRSLGAVNILGNHDAAVIGKTDVDNFNTYAREAVFWTKEHLDRSGVDYLGGLPLIHEEPLFTVVHGTLHDPEEFNYMLSGPDAMHTFEILKKQLCFVGHSHVPGVFIQRDGRLVQSYKTRIKIEDGAGYIINAGSVGQPRDDDNRACYCVYYPDRCEIEFHRVEYDIKTAHDRIIAAGLPHILAERLWFGR